MKDFFTDLIKNRKSVAGILVLGILVLSVLIGVRLLENTQIFRSRASGGDEALYNTNRGPKTLGQMKAELDTACFPNGCSPAQKTQNRAFVATLSPFDIFKAYMQAGPTPVFACVVNMGDPNNMPTQLITPELGQEVRVAIARKLEDKRCNQWWSSPTFTHLGTGKTYGVNAEENPNPGHVCRNGRNAKANQGWLGSVGYEGAGPWYDPFDWKQTVNDCFFEPPEAGDWRVNLFYFRGNNCEAKPLETSCTFKVVPAGQGGTTSGGGTTTAPSSNRAGPSSGTVNPNSIPRGTQAQFNATSSNADNIIVQILRDDGNARELGNIPSSQFGQNVSLTIPADYPLGPALIRFYGRKAGLEQEQPRDQTSITITEGNQGGVTPPPTGVTPSQGGVTPPSSGSLYTTTEYWISEDAVAGADPNSPNWNQVPLNLRFKYNATGGNVIDYTLLPRVCVTQPCDTYPRENRTVYVLFIGKDQSGKEVKRVEQNTILLAKSPVLSSASCEIASTGVGSVVTLKGSHFGDASAQGSVQVTGNSVASIASWSDTEVVANLNGSLSGTPEVSLTTSDGQQSQKVQCGVGKSQLDFKATLACKAPNQPLTAANIQVDEISVASGSGAVATSSAVKTILKQSNVSFGSNGQAGVAIPELIEGKAYKLIITAQNILRKVIPFTAQKGTTVLPDIEIPVGDIFPANGDCTINSLDKNEMIRSWTVTKDAVRKADLNGDARVNSIDYSCLIANFNKTCDRP